MNSGETLRNNADRTVIAPQPNIARLVRIYEHAWRDIVDLRSPDPALSRRLYCLVAARGNPVLEGKLHRYRIEEGTVQALAKTIAVPYRWLACTVKIENQHPRISTLKVIWNMTDNKGVGMEIIKEGRFTDQRHFEEWSWRLHQMIEDMKAGLQNTNERK